MGIFLKKHEESILGVVEGFDRPECGAGLPRHETWRDGRPPLAQFAAEQSGQAGIGKPLTAEQRRIRQSRELR